MTTVDIDLEFSEPVTSTSFNVGITQQCRELKKEYDDKNGKYWSGEKHAYVPIDFWRKVESLLKESGEGGAITLTVN